MGSALKKTAGSAKSFLENVCNEATPASRRDNFSLLWKTLEEMDSEGARQFSVSTVGSRFEKAGGLKIQSLRNAAGADYRQLIELFAAERRNLPQAATTSNPVEVALTRVPNASVRATLRAALAETSKLRLANSRLQRTLKDCSLETERISRKGSSSPITAEASQEEARLSPRMLEALKKGLDPERLMEKGLRVLDNGGIEDAGGVMIFPPGFVDGIRLMLR